MIITILLSIIIFMSGAIFGVISERLRYEQYFQEIIKKNNDLLQQLKVDNQKLKPYKSVCRKCGFVYLTDTEVKDGLCEKCV